MALALHESVFPAAVRSGQVVIRSALRSPTHSHQNRRLARDLVWSWVGEKWPTLMPLRAQLESSEIKRVLPGRKLHAITSHDGSAWTLEVAYTEKEGGNTWTTRAVVADMGDADVVAVQTSCAQLQSDRRVAPPRILGRWVQRLQLDDAGVAVQGEPRTVVGDDDLGALCDHLLAPDRELPVIVLANRGMSRYYGVDPQALAEAVRGLAHVVCLPPEGVAAVTDRFGRSLAPLATAVRIYMPGFLATDPSRDHPLIQRRAAPDAGGSAPDANAFRRLVCQRVYELSA